MHIRSSGVPSRRRILQAPVAQSSQSVRVSVDPRAELISIVQAISRYGDILPFLLSSADFPYKQTVVDHFSAFKDHPVVTLFDEVSSQPRMFNFMAPPTTMLYVTPELTPRNDVVWPESVLARIGGRDRLAIFLDHLRDFAMASGFDGFYRDHATFYEQLVAGVIPKLGTHDYVAELEAFYGRRLPRLVVHGRSRRSVATGNLSLSPGVCL